MVEGVTIQMAEVKKVAKKAAPKKADPFEALQKAVEAARKAGLVVKALATDGQGTTVRF